MSIIDINYIIKYFDFFFGRQKFTVLTTQSDDRQKAPVNDKHFVHTLTIIILYQHPVSHWDVDISVGLHDKL